MIFTTAIAGQIASGQVGIVYRRWASPRVRAGSLLHTTAGMVRIEAVDQIDAALLTDADAAAAGEQTLDHLLGTFRGDPADPVFKITVCYHGPDPRGKLSADTDLDAEDLAEIDSALARLDRRATRPWTERTLWAIAANPGQRSRRLADDLDSDQAELKLNIRKLKNLGLTLSLDTGYQISPRGRRYLEHASSPD